jgi:hypothetical protein
LPIKRMPIIEKHNPSDGQWFKAECHREPQPEATEWDSRHVALVGVDANDWIISEEHIAPDWWSDEFSKICRTSLTHAFHAKENVPGAFTVSLFDGAPSRSWALRLQAEQRRVEFEALAKKWQRDTKHLSLISKKTAHPAYFRIMGMGEAAIPLLLEALRDKPGHWFEALRATANVDPSPVDANPSRAREAWLEWGRSQGLVD